jgi:hypothetical protein
MDKVTKAVDEGKAVDIFYLDFAKAFDKVPRQRLVKKLRAKGVEEKTVTWIENWLSGRTQRVCIKGEQSDSCPVESGVPQGTVLGPTLFTVYIDDLDLEVLKRMLSVWMVKFADDTKGGKIIENDSDREELQMTLDLGDELQHQQVQDNACWQEQSLLRVHHEGGKARSNGRGKRHWCCDNEKSQTI